MKFILTLLSFLLLSIAQPAFAGPCVMDQSACIDSTPCKTVAGETICLASMSETCWKYKDDYTCVKEGAETQCLPFINLMPDCWQTGTTCITPDPSTGSCLTYDQTWACKDWNLPAPPDAIQLANTINYVRDKINDSSCSTSGAGCTQTGETCIEGPETRSISGINVFKNCWKWSRNYTCTSANSADCIANDTDPSCTMTSKTCTTINGDGSCALYTKTYTCSSGTISSAGDTLCGGGGPPCTTVTSQLPPETRTEGCQETLEANPSTCSLTRDVQVSKDYLYKCTSSNNRTQVYPCSKTLNVIVNVNNTCAPDTWVAVPGFETYTQLEYFCELNPVNGKLKFRFTPINLHGVCQIGYAELPRAPFTVAEATSLAYFDVCDQWGDCVSSWAVDKSVAHFIHHWKGACTVGQAVTYALGPQGCVGGMCNYTFTVWETGAGNASFPNGVFYGTDILRVETGGPRWGNVYTRGANMLEPKKIVTTSDAWIDQCVVLESRSQ